MESYEIKSMSVSYSRRIKISFCTVAIEITEEVKKSVESIISIAEEIGYPYELIVSTHEIVNFRSENIEFINSKFSTYGAGKQLALLKSTGDILIIFNPHIKYGAEISDIIYNFLKKEEKKVLISDIMIIPRDLIHRAGGWRNLREYEDIDLLARIIQIGSLIAFPSYHYDSIEYRNKGKRTAIERIRDFRDAIIGANYDFRDINILHMEPYYISYTAFIISKFSGLKPFKHSYKKNRMNNKIIVMESIVESLVLKDYENYYIPQSIPKLLISRDEINYMEKRSKLWRNINKSIAGIIQENDE